MQPSGRVDEDDVAVPGLRGPDGVEHDRGRIASGARPHQIDVGAAGPYGELLDRRRTEGVRRADQRPAAVPPQQAGQLPDRGRLAGAVDADHEHHVRRRAGRRDRFRPRQNLQDLLPHQFAQSVRRRRGCCARTQPADDACGGGDSDVGAQQRLLDRLDLLVIVGRRAGDAVQTSAELGRGPPEPLTQPAEQIPRGGGGGRHPVSTSDRCRLSINASTAARGRVRPARTSAICDVIGSSTP